MTTTTACRISSAELHRAYQAVTMLAGPARLADRRDGELIARDLQVAGLLFQHYRRHDGRCDPGLTRLARLGSCCVRTIQRSLDRLRVAGVITWRRNAGTRSTNAYELNLGFLLDHVEQSAASCGKREVKMAGRMRASAEALARHQLYAELRRRGLLDAFTAYASVSNRLEDLAVAAERRRPGAGCDLVHERLLSAGLFVLADWTPVSSKPIKLVSKPLSSEAMRLFRSRKSPG